LHSGPYRLRADRGCRCREKANQLRDAIDKCDSAARLRELASVRRRLGYCRLHFLLKREGIMNYKKRRRLYREEQLQVRRCGGTGADRLSAAGVE